MKYFIYARKSSEDDGKQIQSIDDQLAIAKKTAQLKGIEVIEVLTESKSASSPGRPVFNYLMNRINNGDAQGIICWKLDRLSRNPIDTGNVMWKLQKGIIQKIITDDREYEPSDYMMMMHFEFGMASQFSLDLGKNAKRGMKSKCEKGWLPGVAPLGYLNNRYKEKGEKDILKDDERFPIVRKMWDLMLTGQFSLKKICEKADKEWGFKMPIRRVRGGGPISTSTLYGILTNPFYYGEFKWDSEWYNGEHPPMVTRDEFDHVQRILQSKGKPRLRRRVFAFTGMIRCGECGCMITAQENTKFIKSTKSIKKYTYYTCTHKSKIIKCTQKCIEQKKLDEQILSFLETISIEQVHIDWIIKYLHEFNEYESNDRHSVSTGIKKELNNRTKELDNLIRLKISRGDLLTDDEFREQKERLVTEKKALLDKLNKLDARQNNWVESAEKSVNFLRSVTGKFKQGGVEEKKLILSTLGANLVLKDRILSVEAKNEYLPLQKGVIQTKQLLKRLKPQKGRLKTTKKALNDGLRLVWLQRLEAICRYFAFEKGAYCPNLRLEERLANKTDEWVM